MHLKVDVLVRLVRALAEAGLADLKFKLVNRNVNHPFTPVGVYVI